MDFSILSAATLHKGSVVDPCIGTHLGYLKDQYTTTDMKSRKPICSERYILMVAILYRTGKIEDWVSVL